MKNKIVFILAVVFLSSVLYNLGFISGAVQSCSPNITLINQDPYPAIPNSYVKLVFEVSQLENCEGFAVKFDPKYPFSLDSGEDPIQVISANPYSPDYKASSSNYKGTWIVTYKVRVAEDSLDGDYDLILNYHEGDSRDFGVYSFQKTFNVNVEDSQTTFDAVIQESTSSDVSIAIANTGKYTANSVVVRIPEQESFSVTGTDGQMVGNLESGDYTIVGFSVSPKASRNASRTTDSNQKPSTKLKFDIYYTDNIAERRIVHMELPLNVAGNYSSFSSAFANRKTTTSTSSSYYWYILIGIIVIIVFVIYKYPKQTKDFFNKIKSKSKTSKKGVVNRENVPDWIKNTREKEKK